MSDDAPLKLIYIGRLVRHKGIFEAVEAVRILQERNIHVRLNLVGAGPDTEELRRSILEAGVQDCVQVLGPQYGADKERVLEESDVLVMPCLWRGPALYPTGKHGGRRGARHLLYRWDS